MFKIEKLKVEHIKELSKENINQDVGEFFTDSLCRDLASQEGATFILNGEIMVCGGITNYWKGRGHIWTLFSEKSKRHFVSTLRAIKSWLDYEIAENYERIELSVPCSFEIGQRRALILGFKVEAPLARKFLPSGEDCVLFSMVRE